VGAFLFEHILISNSTAISGPDAYARQVSFLANLPLVFFLELFGIWLPIAFHALYGFYIWYRGDGNTIEYPWTGNWMYTLQRWSGGVAFVCIRGRCGSPVSICTRILTRHSEKCRPS
jgi:succinate dehydrogenase / fumarate reductase cytochrome b subunit